METKMIEKLARLIELSNKFKMNLEDCVELPTVNQHFTINSGTTCNHGFVTTTVYNGLQITGTIVPQPIEEYYVEAIKEETNERITKIKEYYEYTTLLEEFKAYTDSLLKLSK